jgi:hypothetical protein
MLIFQRDDPITDPNDSADNNLGAQTAAVNQTAHRARLSEFFQVPAGFAQSLAK